MLLGTYQHALDAKNRIIIPSKLMDELSGKLYIYPAANKTCIKLYDEEHWNRYAEIIANLPQEIRYGVQSRIFPNSQQVAPDAQNRVPIPAVMLEKVGIGGKNVITVGMGDYCEIWDPEKYEAAQSAPVSPEIEKVIASMGF